MLKLKVTKQSEAIKELISRFTLPAVESTEGYQAKPRLRRNLLGAASSVPTTAKDRYILQNIAELLSRTIVE